MNTLKAKQMTPSLYLLDSIVYTGKISPKIALSRRKHSPTI